MMNLVYGSLFSSLMAFLCFTVMSEFSLDEPGFKAPGALTPVPLPRILPWRLLLTVAASVLLVPGG